MNKKKFLSFIFAATTSSMFALCPQTYLDLFAGAQTNQASFEIPALSGVPLPITESYSLKKLNGWKVGLDGQVALSHRWYVKGIGSYGIITSGTFEETSGVFTETRNVKGNTVNLEAAVGYNFYPTQCFSIAPTFGWAYDKLEVYTSNGANRAFPINFSKNKIQWGGPFLGADMNYFFNKHWSVFGEYELHLASTQLKLWSPGSTDPTIRGHIRNLIGNLGRVGLVYTTDCGWRFGLNGSYKYYSSGRKGTVDPETVAGVYSESQLQNTRMRSSEIVFSGGYQF